MTQKKERKKKVKINNINQLRLKTLNSQDLNLVVLRSEYLPELLSQMQILLLTLICNTAFL